ncbi:MAG TPA: glycosyltransferase family 87 protein [Acidimicrobiales bacterium]|nr:glycosyltransferase family 87 protein [Acidimicrobiales bacterium]
MAERLPDALHGPGARGRHAAHRASRSPRAGVGHSSARLRDRVLDRCRRAAVLGPVLLTTFQVVLAYLRLRAPSSIVLPNGNISLSFQGPLSARLGYSDLYTEYALHGLFHHPWPYVNVPIEYPVLTGVYMTAAAALTHGVRAYFLLSSVGLLACALGSVLVLWSISRRAAWWLSACPLVFVYTLLNWDFFAIFLMLLGWRAYRRERYAWAGIWLAAGACAKAFPALFLLYGLVELARRARRGETSRRSARAMGTSALLVVVVVNVPFMVLNMSSWLEFWRFNAERHGHAGLLYRLGILSHVSVGTADDVLLGLVGLIGIAGAFVIWRRAPDLTRVAAVAFAAFLAVEKVYSPQYTLWLFVFALLAQWEAWTLVLLTAGGLYDYVNSAIIINLTANHSPAFYWYHRRVFPLGEELRLSAILVGTAGTTAQAWWRRRRATADGNDAPVAFES